MDFSAFFSDPQGAVLIPGQTSIKDGFWRWLDTDSQTPDRPVIVLIL